MMDSKPRKISLALSGGGFRATLFHLGVVRCLYENDLLTAVDTICSVSGGSILAAHMALRWSHYTGSEDFFATAVNEIKTFTQSDLRGRILRRWICGTAWMLPRIFGKQTLVSLLVEHYATLYKGASISMLRERLDQPDVHILSTSLTSGCQCKFTSEGFTFDDGNSERLIRNESLPLALAVAASSAFPPLFPPVAITRKLLNTGVNEFSKIHFLTDGGIYDNLGLNELSKLCTFSENEDRVLVVCDAGGHFDWSDDDKTFSSFVSRNVRATDILMNRISKLVPSSIKVSGIRLCAIQIGNELSARQESTALPATEQRTAQNTRTDLDAFSDDEVARLFRHGYSQARFALRNLGIPIAQSKYPNSISFKKTGIQEANRRKWQLFSARDSNSWLTVVAILFWIVVLIFPSSYYALKQKQKAQVQKQNADNLSHALIRNLNDPNGVSRWPTCVGVWKETKVGYTGKSSEVSPLTWFSTSNETSNTPSLHLIREDGFAQAAFHWQDPKWIGEIKFGNGDTWPGVELTPNHECTLVTTNQNWWYLPSKSHD